MLSGWAYGGIYRNSDERTAALDGWVWHYNCQRRHSALGHKPSIARLDARKHQPSRGLTPRSHDCTFEVGKVCGPGNAGRQQAKQWSAGDSTTPADPTRSN